MGRIIVALCALGVAACSGINLEPDPVPVQPAPVVVVDPCEGVSVDAVTYVDDPSAAALSLACGAPSEVPFELAIALFDQWDDVAAAAVVLRCADSEACNAERPAGLGLFGYIAANMAPPSDVADALGFGPEAAALYVERVGPAPEVIATRVAELGPVRQRIYVELPGLVRDDLSVLRSTFSAFASHYAGLRPVAEAEIESGEADPTTAAELRSLRIDYVRDCHARSGMALEECINGPIARPLTELLLRHALASGDVAAARVELALATFGADRSTFMAALVARQGELKAVEAENHAAAMAALAEGAAPEDVEDLYGPTADVNSDAPLPYSPEEPAVDPASVIGRAENVVGLVDDIDVDDGEVEVDFRRVYVEPDEFRCVESDEPSIDWGSREIAMPDCDDFDERIRLRPDPIFLDLDASTLEEGNLIEAWVDPDTRRGRLLRVYEDEDDAELLRLGPFETAD